MGLRGLDDLAQPKLEMVRGQCHTLEMALEEVAIIVGQLLPGAARAQVAAQRSSVVNKKWLVVSKNRMARPRERKRVDDQEKGAAAGSRSAKLATICRQVATDSKSSHSPCPAAVQNQEKGAAAESVERRTRR